VSIWSSASEMGRPCGATKGGVNSLQSLAADMALHGFGVNCPAEGAIQPEGCDGSTERIGHDPGAVDSRAPSTGGADEIACPVLLLVSATASHVSGQTVHASDRHSAQIVA
jgi:NAD(P)-dependent dehydrogenase (short-subunit alcohol dehydrogenase family)